MASAVLGSGGAFMAGMALAVHFPMASLWANFIGRPAAGMVIRRRSFLSGALGVA
jgi:hypothetical protein